MEVITRAPLSTMKSVDSDTITGPTANLMPAYGARTKWMARANSNGKTAKSTPASSSMISVRDKVLSFGLTDANTSANGRLVNSTESALTLAKKALRNRVNGRMVAKSGGWTTQKAMLMLNNRTMVSTKKKIEQMANNLGTLFSILKKKLSKIF